jgi:hypothetical protein
MPQSAVPEGLVKFAHAVIGSASLRSWFYSLEHLPRTRRDQALLQMAEQMRRAKEDPDLVSAISLLARANMFDTVLAAVRERVDETSSQT